MIITIDGPAGTGKTTVAKHVAEELGYTYFDTGAMYRAVTYGIIKYSININDPQALQTYLDSFPVTIKSHLGQKFIFLKDEDVTDKIRSLDVTRRVSEVAAIRAVREKLVATQRELAKGVNAVFEGRDTGTVVFPDAKVKVFLTAESRVRSERRYKELVASNPGSAVNLSIEMVMEEMDKRDKYDASRDISPMRPAEGATIIDTSKLTIEEVVNQIVVLKERIETRPLTSA